MPLCEQILSIDSDILQPINSQQICITTEWASNYLIIFEMFYAAIASSKIVKDSEEKHKKQILFFLRKLTNGSVALSMTYLCRDLFEQILLVFVDFVTLAVRALRYFLIQFLDVGDICIWYLLNNFDNMRKFRTQYLVHLHTEGD